MLANAATGSLKNITPKREKAASKRVKSLAVASARLGVISLSLLGIPGAYLMGTALAGRVGGIAAAVLLAITPMYFQQAHALEAEGPAIGLLFLTIGAAFMWWERPTGRSGVAFAMVCAVSLRRSGFLQSCSTSLPSYQSCCSCSHASGISGTRTAIQFGAVFCRLLPQFSLVQLRRFLFWPPFCTLQTRSGNKL